MTWLYILLAFISVSWFGMAAVMAVLEARRDDDDDER